jgi:hypothetical protein
MLQDVWERTGSELDSMVGDTNLFLSEGGKHAEVSNWHYFSIMKTFLVADSVRLTVDSDCIRGFDDQNNCQRILFSWKHMN